MTLKDKGILILDYGSQTGQLIARRVRELNVYTALLPYDTTLEEAQATIPDFRGIILSGGPRSVYGDEAPRLPDWVLEQQVPVLGICYGMQLLTHSLGGRVVGTGHSEFGLTELDIRRPVGILKGQGGKQEVWMSHTDRVELLPEGFMGLAETPVIPFAAMSNTERRIYGVQYHPEVTHTPRGREMIHNFVLGICTAEQNWHTGDFIETSVKAIQEQVGDGTVLVAMSGGVDSAVVAGLVQRAIGDRLIAIFVNHGLLRKGEAEEVIEVATKMNIKLNAVDATEVFLSALENVPDPEEKRKIIGELFIQTFEKEAEKVGKFDWLAQGTIYPDVIESAGTGRMGVQLIKTHHNVAGLPERMKDKVVEPLRDLFKDEVRKVAMELGLPDEIVWRQPFPGPGLAIRCLGQITKRRLQTLREADAIFLHELEKAGKLREETSQAFAILLPVKTVGVIGDHRLYEEVVVLRAVTTDDFMTADWAKLPYELLAKVSKRILEEVDGVSRVAYDISTKPPATIEWE